MSRRIQCGLMATLLMIACVAVPLFADDVVIPEGTVIVLKLAQTINIRSAVAGSAVEFAVAQDVKVGDVVVIAADSRALGTVSVSREAAIFRDGAPSVEIGLWMVKAGDAKVFVHGLLRLSDDAAVGMTAKAFVQQDTVLHVEGTVTEHVPEVPPGKLRVPNGREVRVMLLDRLVSDRVHAGDQVPFRVLNDIVVDDLVVIARGSPAKGTIKESKAARMGWKSGTLALELSSVKLVDGSEAKISFADSARGGPTGALQMWGGLIYYSRGLAIFALPLAPLQHGKQAVIPRGTPVEAYLDGEIVLDKAAVEKAQPKPKPAPSGPAFVTLYYPETSAYVGSAKIWCGKVDVGILPRGNKLRIHLRPGHYYMRAWTDGKATEVDVTEGADLYLRLSSDATAAGGALPAYELVDEEIGKIESEDTKPVKKNFRDVSGQPLADLTALRPEPQKKKR